MAGGEVWSELARTAGSVALAVLPLALLFVGFQALVLRLPRTEVRRIATGTLLASAGLLLFLVGVEVGFLPLGAAIGARIGAMPQKWLLVPFGALLGFVTTWGEPAVRILADQAEEASSGSIRPPLVVGAVCVGVAVAVALGLLRIGYGVPLLWLLVPGYALAIVMVWLSDRGFMAIAVDSGGVATGPLANTFLLALALGASSAVAGEDAAVLGFGLVALIALAPIVSVMALGLVVRAKQKRRTS